MKTNEANDLGREFLNLYRNSDNPTKICFVALLIHYSEAPTKDRIRLMSSFFDCEIQTAIEKLEKRISENSADYIEAARILFEELQRRRNEAEKNEIF